jgi:hypothetical protein
MAVPIHPGDDGFEEVEQLLPFRLLAREGLTSCFAPSKQTVSGLRRGAFSLDAVGERPHGMG